jgi:hypothetical protein
VNGGAVIGLDACYVCGLGSGQGGWEGSVEAEVAGAVEVNTAELWGGWEGRSLGTRDLRRRRKTGPGAPREDCVARPVRRAPWRCVVDSPASQTLGADQAASDFNALLMAGHL